VDAVGPGGDAMIPVSNPFSFTQACSYSLSGSSASFASVGGGGSVGVTTGAGCPWTASSGVSWITLGTTGGTGSATIIFTAAANTSSANRSGTLTIAGATYAVTQQGAGCGFSLSSYTQTLGASGGTGSVGVTSSAGCSWTAASNASWMTLTAGSSGSGSGSVSYTVGPNSTAATRSATATIAGLTYTVYQAAAPVVTQSSGIWMSREQLLARPMSGAAWTSLKSAADRSCGTPDLGNQDDPVNVCVMAQALVFARTGTASYRTNVVTALRAVVNSGTYSGRALALGRELAAYVIAADLVDLKTADPTLDAAFRTKIKSLLTTPTTGGPASLVDCHETRPNNWGTHCGASRAAVAAYLGDAAQLARVATVFKGWLGDRAAYAKFAYGDLSWQCNAAAPVGINPAGCTKLGHPIDGVLPDDQRRTGGFTWPPPKENYVYEALQGALVQAVILGRAGYDVFAWQDQALLRAATWLNTTAAYPAGGDDTWQPHLVNYFYHTTFPAPIPSSPGKNVGWTDWTHGK
jgi:hypothetical protein